MGALLPGFEKFRHELVAGQGAAPLRPVVAIDAHDVAIVVEVAVGDADEGRAPEEVRRARVDVVAHVPDAAHNLHLPHALARGRAVAEAVHHCSGAVVVDAGLDCEVRAQRRVELRRQSALHHRGELTPQQHPARAREQCRHLPLGIRLHLLHQAWPR